MSDSIDACAGCGTGLAPAMLVCPVCGALVHAAELRKRVAEAEQAERDGHWQSAMDQWTAMLALLPAESGQHAKIARHCETIRLRLAAAPPPLLPVRDPRAPGWGIGALVIALLTKGKFLLAAATKGTALFPVLASLGVYGVAFGWWLGLGLLVSLYVHELGHVFAFRRHGIPSSGPMFVPGLGAFVRGKIHPANRAVDARIGLAGPAWGLGAAMAFALAGRASGSVVLVAIANLGAVINLLNLVPVWTLDGARAFRALSGRQRWTVVVLLAGAALLPTSGIVTAILLGAAYQTYRRIDEAPAGESAIVTRYLVLVGALAALAWLTTAPAAVAR